MARLDQDRQNRLEPQRMESTRKKLVSLGCKVTMAYDGKAWDVTFPDGRFVRFWPYSGWFSGKKGLQGRGFAKLLDAIARP
jgi:hypothetical protein